MGKYDRISYVHLGSVWLPIKESTWVFILLLFLRNIFLFLLLVNMEFQLILDVLQWNQLVLIFIIVQ